MMCDTKIIGDSYMHVSLHVYLYYSHVRITRNFHRMSTYVTLEEEVPVEEKKWYRREKLRKKRLPGTKK